MFVYIRSAAFIVVVTQKLVLQQSKNVTTKCTETISPPPSIQFSLVLATFYKCMVYTCSTLAWISKCIRLKKKLSRLGPFLTLSVSLGTNFPFICSFVMLNIMLEIVSLTDILGKGRFTKTLFIICVPKPDTQCQVWT